MAHSDTQHLPKRSFGSENYFDAQPIPQATTEDLNLDLVRRHIRHASEQVPRFEAPDDPLDFLRSRNCLLEDTPTVPATILIHCKNRLR